MCAHILTLNVNMSSVIDNFLCFLSTKIILQARQFPPNSKHDLLLPLPSPQAFSLAYWLLRLQGNGVLLLVLVIANQQE